MEKENTIISNIIRKKASIVVIVFALLFGMVMPVEALAQTDKVTTGYAPIHGLEMYYEIHGEGEPLILLHGGLGSTDMFNPILPKLTEAAQVITVDLQAHGRTADIDRPLSYKLMADDIAALIKYLGYESADVMGYSLGGGVAIQTAIRHPEVVEKLIVVSAPFKRKGWYPKMLAGQAMMSADIAKQMKQTPIYQNYARIAPNPEDWPVLLEKIGNLLRKDYNWSEEVAEIEAPTLLVFGDADGIPPSHAVAFFELLGGGQHWVSPRFGAQMPNVRLAILPGTTHREIHSSPELADVVTDFLNQSFKKSNTNK